MNSIFKYGAIAFASAFIMTSCDDWTETESVGLAYPTPEESAPEVYAAYLQNLREYRDTDHKKVYAWFDNVDAANGQGQRLSVIPDSIDVVSLTNPASVSQQTLRDMKKVREDKGMKVIYTIDYDAIANDYLALKEKAADAGTEVVSLRTFVTDTTTKALQYAGIYGFDGVCVSYIGKDRIYLSTPELTEYEAMENLFLGLVSDWAKRHENMTVDFLGNPQNLLDKDFLKKCGMVFVSGGLNAGGKDAFTYYFSLASQQGVPADRIGMVTRSVSNSDTKAGVMSDGSNAVETLGIWAASVPSVAGIGFYGINGDYHSADYVYSHARRSIQSVNPSGK